MRKLRKILFIIFIISVISVTVVGEKSGELSIAAGVVPHHLLAKDIMEYYFGYITSQEQHPDTIILLSPDHFNSATIYKKPSFISINWEADDVKLGEISVDCELLKELSMTNEIKSNRSAVLSEFGMMNLLPFIREALPEAMIVPLIMPAYTSREQVENLVRDIHEKSYKNTLMIASVDFSHYLPPEAAAFHDAKSIRVLLNCEKEHFENIEVDSWQSLYAIRLFAKLRESEKPTVIAHKNSVDFLPYDLNSTTSYFSVIFQDGKPPEDLQVETILLTGDMILGRGIEELMKQNSVYYPFQKIVQLLRGVDIVFANLEGPVVENPPEFSDDLLKFSFHPNVLEGVRWSQINLLSLANNHTLDMGEEGLEETRDWLDKYQIHAIGNPLSGYQDGQNPSFSTEHSFFLAFNRVLPFIHYREEIIKEITTAKINHPEKFLIVSMHWGNEYEPFSSSVQQDLAKEIIAAGADLIAGHHPHVVQEIGLIKDKPVFYSLGNFIFDQQTLPETQEGLLVGLTIETDRITYRLFPVKNHSGQPVLMNQKERKVFLKNLARKSDQRLWKEIEKGIIEIKRMN